jgi:hypothetical protein
LGRRRRFRSSRLPTQTPTAQDLPPDEERRREDEDDERDPRVQAQRPELVRGVDPQQFLEEAARGVEHHVEREESGRSEPEQAVEHEQDSRADRYVHELVEERRMERLRVRIGEGAVLGVDLETPGEVGRFPEELLVPPVAEASDPVGEQQARRGRVHQREGALAGPPGDDGADKRAQEDPAPDAETAPPDHEDALPLRIGHLRPAREHVVGTGADDSGGNAPDGDPQEQVPVASLGPGTLRPAQPGDDDADRDREQQHQPVHVDRHGPDLEEAVHGRRNRRDHGPHSADRISRTFLYGTRFCKEPSPSTAWLGRRRRGEAP